jgi:hypothetical protein
MALRTTDTTNRMISESVLLTLQIKTKIEQDREIDEERRMGGIVDTGMMAATLASAIISTFGKSILGSPLFEEVDDSEIPPANMAAAEARPAT